MNSKTQKKKRSKFRKIWNTISTVILVLVVILVAFIFICRLTGHVPSIFGYTFFRVQTDSMSPTLEPGDVIVDKKVPAEEIKKGDIITFNCLSGTMAGKTITHRVVEEPELIRGKYWFQTQGDREGAPLDDKITYDQIEGKMISNAKWLNKLYSFFLTPYGLIAFVVLIIVLFGYEIVSMLVSARKFEKTLDSYDEAAEKLPPDSPPESSTDEPSSDDTESKE